MPHSRMMKEHPGQSNDRRRGERKPVDSETVLRVGVSNEGIAVSVRDISRSGCGLVSARKLAVGEEVQLGLDGAGTVLGWVVDAREDHYGIEFARPLATPEMVNAFTGAKIITLYPAQMIPDPEITPFARPIRLGIWVVAGAMGWLGVMLAVSVMTA